MSLFNQSGASIWSRRGLISLVALAGIGSAAVATEASAEGYYVETTAQTANFAPWDRLNIRAWPASHSKKLARIANDRTVYVERCIIKSGADWCKIRRGWKYGWVNGRFLKAGPYDFSKPHPWF